ncbi:hypothetical protein M758_2G207300 [Ceratodon purpureus]|nr:hypothetical protein M758_2G207300 [Ceratodon purpureus]
MERHCRTWRLARCTVNSILYSLLQLHDLWKQNVLLNTDVYFIVGWWDNRYAQSPRDLFPQDMYHRLQFIGLTKLTSLERRKMSTCPHAVGEC